VDSNIILAMEHIYEYTSSSGGGGKLKQFVGKGESRISRCN
jgi:hypothetical protein